jgi:site-specific DNA-methyltransferase (adenine-specific)
MGKGKMNTVLHGDCCTEMKKLQPESVDIIICDPPYNIGKDFGNSSDKMELSAYLAWCAEWLHECFRVLKKTGTCFVYGYSETLALIFAQMKTDDILTWKTKWLVWHYTNRVNPRLNFWQRTHESILCCHFQKSVFNRDLVREPYSDEFLKGSAGKTRMAAKSRINYKGVQTVYTAHPDGALPRDVLKLSALTGACGKRERVDHPAQKPLDLCEKLILSCLNVDGETLVLVPFAGSGSECVAAQKLKCNFLGIELNGKYVELCKERLRNERNIIAEAV